jgi:nicotinamidase-related amidase
MGSKNREVLMKRALLVIDVQNEYFSGLLPITYPQGHLTNILRVMDAAVAQNIPLVVVQQTFPQPDKPLLKRDIPDWELHFFQHGTPEWELHPEVQARPHDLLIEKHLPGSFTETELEPWLRQQGVDTVVVAGYMTHMCCDTTAKQAVHLGFTVEFLSDATGTLPLSNTAGDVTAEELQRAILCTQQMLLSEVISTDAWCDRIAGDAPRILLDKLAS